MDNYKELRDTVDSDEEVYTLWWLEELKQYGYINDYYRAPSYQLTDEVKVSYTHQLKTKMKIVETTLLPARIYTPDYVIEATHNKLFQNIDNLSTNPNGKVPVIIMHDNKALVEVKGVYNNANMVRVFKINQKELFAKYNFYANLLTIPTTFYKTFMPERYLTTNISNKPRTIKGKFKLIEEYFSY